MQTAKYKQFSLYSPVFSWITSYKQLIDVAVKLGVPAVEGLNLFELATPDVEAAKELRAYAEERGIVFSCMSLAVDLVGGDTAKLIEDAKGYADVAKALGVPYLHHTIAFNFIDPTVFDGKEEESFQCGLQAVRAIYDYADSIGIRTIFEDQGYLFNGVKNFGRFLNEVERDVGVVADVGNIYFADESIEGFLEAFMPRVCHVHLKDFAYIPADAVAEEPPHGYISRHGYISDCEIGQGAVNFKEVLPTIRKAGYTGYYGLEFGAPEDDEQKFLESLDFLQACMEL